MRLRPLLVLALVLLTAATGCPRRPSPSSVDGQVIAIVAELTEHDAARIDQKTDLARDLGMDDLDKVELVLQLEDEFDVAIPDAEAEKIKTVGQAIDCVKQRLADKGGVVPAPGGAKRKKRSK